MIGYAPRGVRPHRQVPTAPLAAILRDTAPVVALRIERVRIALAGSVVRLADLPPSVGRADSPAHMARKTVQAVDMLVGMAADTVDMFDSAADMSAAVAAY